MQSWPTIPHQMTTETHTSQNTLNTPNYDENYNRNKYRDYDENYQHNYIC